MKTSTAKPWHTSFHLGQSKTSQRAQPPLSQPCHSHNIQIGPGLFDFSLSFLTQHFIDLIVEEDTAGRLQRAKPEPHQRMTQTAKTSPNQSPTQETGKLTWHYLLLRPVGESSGPSRCHLLGPHPCVARLPRCCLTQFRCQTMLLPAADSKELRKRITVNLEMFTTVLF
ncbi:uncharacterized protein LOC144910446 isoform X1 [Branchiostoma floridae x Branchiostoma belcheri]